MSDPLFWHRVQFGFTISFHYLFPQLSMGLALLIVVMKGVALRTGQAVWADTARFWVRVFGLTFAMGVVTGLPMEFQFGTNWAAFSAQTGGVIGQTLAMEGVFAFFLESSVLALLVYGEQRLGARRHFLAALALFFGSWLSGYFIVTTNAFMQHPVGYARSAAGVFEIADLGAYLANPWALAQYAHTMMGAVVTGAFALAAVGAYWTLRGEHLEPARISLRVGVVAALLASVLTAMPTGHHQATLVATHQPVTLAAMEGHFESGPRAPIAVIGQPNVAARRLDNPLFVPALLSFIAYGDFQANVRGLADFPVEDWPTQIELLYYAFHVMVGLGTLFIAISALAVLELVRGRLASNRALLWVLLLALPFPFIANTAGWLSAEQGRQPWLVYGLLRTAAGGSPTVHGGSTLFTLLGFAGLYALLGLAYLGLVARELAHGPTAPGTTEAQH